MRFSRRWLERRFGRSLGLGTYRRYFGSFHTNSHVDVELVDETDASSLAKFGVVHV